MKLTTYIFTLLAFMPYYAHSQLKVYSINETDKTVIEVLLGGSVEAENVSYTGHIEAFKLFTNVNTVLPVKQGIILSTGLATTATELNRTTAATTNLGQLGDEDLNKLAGTITKDAAVLEFDFIPAFDSVYFNYVFASEEYPEYVGSRFNDVFGFFVSGPGIAPNTNIAVLPETGEMVSVNSINQRKNSDHFIFNKPFFQTKDSTKIQYDGLTKALAAGFHTLPSQRYHIKIAVADVTDADLDSAVFLEGGSFKSTKSKNPKGEKPRSATITTLAEKKQPQKAFEFSLANEVYFDFNSTVIPDSSKKELSELAVFLNKQKALQVELFGHTDTIGSEKYNQQLSEKRARAVANYLINSGVEAKRLSIKGFNYSRPESSNETAAGRAKNRRVEITIVK